MQKTAIFGGTFDPPHIGHKVMLEGLSALEDIDRILVMPSKMPPHKERKVSSFEDRVNMCRLAFSGVKKAVIDLTEQKLSGKSYTIHTLEYFKNRGVEYPALVIGGDSLKDFHKWYRYDEILKLAEIYVYGRFGVDNREVSAAAESLIKMGGKVNLLNIYPPEISSTMVRELISLGKDATHLITKEVNDYIIEKGLYNGTDF